MTRHDITIPIGVGVPEWPGDTPYSCRWTWEIARGASVNVSEITTSPHVGTHADAPLHVRDGWHAAHELPLEPFMGRAFVCTVSGDATTIELDDLHGLPLPLTLPLSSSPGGVERLLIRSGRSIAGGAFPDSWPALSVAAVRTLLGHGLRLLGVDAPSVDLRASTELEVHHALFERGAYNLENLDLRGVEDGEYDLLALPLKIIDADAAPTRALLVSRDRSASAKS